MDATTYSLLEGKTAHSVEGVYRDDIPIFPTS